MIVVTPAAPVHTHEASRVLAGALREDAMMSAFVGGALDEREERLTHLYREFVRSGLRHGAVDVARAEGSPAILGVAVWSAPGHPGGGLSNQLRGLGSYLRAFGLRRLFSSRALDKALHAARPSEPHWYLAVIGVSAQGRGHGVGSALLESRLSTIDQSGAAAPAYLEASTERSAALYARFGFTPMGIVPGFPQKVEPVAMWRRGACDRSAARQK